MIYKLKIINKNFVSIEEKKILDTSKIEERSIREGTTINVVDIDSDTQRLLFIHQVDPKKHFIAEPTRPGEYIILEYKAIID